MVSTKLLRLPLRGALGNGLRVVAGAVLASSGSLVVITHNKRIVLRPERDGTTTVVNVKAVKFPVGTRVEISFGPAIPSDEGTLSLANFALRLAGNNGKTYTGKSSPHWYDAPQFHELLDASGNTPVRELIVELDGCSGGKAGEIVAAAGLARALCSSVTRPQAEKLLAVARANSKPMTPRRLGAVGPESANSMHPRTARFWAREQSSTRPGDRISDAFSMPDFMILMIGQIYLAKP
jgi:hypothetical protein